MSKTHLEISINNKLHDCVISHFRQVMKNNDGKIIWTKPEEYIAKTQGKVDEITIYIKDDNDNQKVTALQLSAFAIKAIYEQIIEIEAKQYEECVDD